MAAPSSRDPLAGSPWSRPETVQGFTQSPPNAALLVFGEAERRGRSGHGRLLNIGCGAGRNAIPLARLGWNVIGVDLSRPMLAASVGRTAHGIWNLARSSTEFRRAVQEAARVLTPGGGLFVFTFSRHTLPPDTQPALGESFVFTQFSGEPQCFLTEPQLLTELRAAGFAPDCEVPRELHRPRAGTLATAGMPVIYEAVFRNWCSDSRRTDELLNNS